MNSPRRDNGKRMIQTNPARPFHSARSRTQRPRSTILGHFARRDEGRVLDYQRLVSLFPPPRRPEPGHEAPALPGVLGCFECLEPLERVLLAGKLVLKRRRVSAQFTDVSLGAIPALLRFLASRVGLC